MEIERLREPCPKWAANEMQNLRAELATLRLYADEVTLDSNRDLAAKDARIAELETDHLFAEIKRLREACQEFRARAERAEARVAELEGARDACIDDYNTVRARAERAEARIAEFDGYYADLYADLQEWKGGTERAEAELKAVREVLERIDNEGEASGGDWCAECARAALNPSPPPD